MKRFHHLPLILLFLLAGCENGSENITPGFYVFKGGLTLEADTNKATTERVITLTARYNPQLNGTGRLIFRGWGADLLDTVLVMEPISDSLYKTHDSGAAAESAAIVLPLDFIENETGVIEWKVRLLRLDYYSFDAFIFLDSVYIADSARMFALDSDEDNDVIEKYYPLGLEYTAYARMFSLPPY